MPTAGMEPKLQCSRDTHTYIFSLCNQAPNAGLLDFAPSLRARICEVWDTLAVFSFFSVAFDGVGFCVR